MRKFASKEVIGLSVLLVIFVVAVLILTGTGHGGGSVVGPEESVDPSIYNDRASGTRGLYEWCQKLGYRPLVWREDWRSLPSDASVLICTAPRWTSKPGQVETTPGREQYQDGVGALTPEDATGIKNWLASGRTLLLMSSQLPANHLSDPSASAGDDDDETDDSGDPLTFSDILGVGTESSTTGREDFTPAQPGVLTENVTDIHFSGIAESTSLIRVKRDFVVLFGELADNPTNDKTTRDEPVAIQFPVGKGKVIVISDSFFACNSNLARADNASFIASVLRTGAPGGGSVLFDEFHHGDTFGDRDLWTALGQPLRLGLLQLLLALIVLAIALGARFGMPTPLGRIRPHTSAEYVTSLAGLYQNAGASAPALETIYRQFLRDLCSRLALPPDVSLQQLAEAASRRGRLDGNALRQLLSLCERNLDQRQVSEGDLLALVQQMERFRKQLGVV